MQWHSRQCLLDYDLDTFNRHWNSKSDRDLLQPYHCAQDLFSKHFVIISRKWSNYLGNECCNDSDSDQHS